MKKTNPSLKVLLSLLLVGILAVLSPVTCVASDGNSGKINISLLGRYDSADVAAIRAVDVDNKEIRFRNHSTGKTYTLSYDNTSMMFDIYGRALSPRLLEVGQIVEVTFLKSTKHITTLDVSREAWTIASTRDHDLVRNDGTAVVKGDVYKIDPRTLRVEFYSLPGARVYAKNISAEGLQSGKQLPLGPALLGRVLDGSGKPLDGLPFPDTTETGALITPPFNPLQRTPIEHVLDTGVRPINALLTVGRGQRMGLFAGSGVGKSVLLGMMARYTRADVIVVGLIGERGREVKDFIENILGAEGRARSVVIAAPADVSPLLRMQGAAYATRIAEDFRDRGQHVLLIMDSLTRYAMAQREIALAIGEPPATKGYPPSVFAKLPALVERAGNGISGGGSITAFYTVLTEGDDQQDPIADSARQSSTVTLCCLADWRKPGTIRLSILKRRSVAQ